MGLSARESRDHATRPSEAQHVEHRGVVPLDSRRQKRSSPMPRLPPRIRRALAERAAGRRCLIMRARVADVLPFELEPHEIRWADRLDLRSQSIERVAMNAGEEPAIAPFGQAWRSAG